MYGDVILLRGGMQPAGVGRYVIVVRETGLAVITPLYHVLCYASGRQA